jgi:hypothetical protein
MRGRWRFGAFSAGALAVRLFVPLLRFTLTICSGVVALAL